MPNKKEYVKYFFDDKEYLSENKTFTYVMSLGDISLGFDLDISGVKNTIKSGMSLTIGKKEKFNNLCLFLGNKVVGTFSNKFNILIMKKLNQGFNFNSCIIEYIVLWENKDLKKNLIHPLCKIVMKSTWN